METNHHSRKRKHAHENKSRLGESGKHHKHSNHDSTHQRHPRDHSSGGSAEKRQPLAIRDQNELSGDKNYIRSWLAQTQNEDITESLEPLKQTSRKLGHLEEKARHSDYIDTAHIPGKSRVTTKSKPKPGQETVSFDSSLLEAPRVPVVKGRTRTPRKLSSTYDGKKTTQTHKHRKKPASSVTSSSSQYSVVQPKQETFEKRARHKTKEDRYDTKKKSNKAEVVNKPIKTRREKRGDRKKAARKASQDLMNNFASNKIGLDRLSARPPNGPGIFQNGRASSPPRRRGLPDLAFSEMEFLQRSGKKSHMNDNIVVPRSRAKEKRKAARAQDEIAAFFKPSKTPVRDNSSTIEHPASPSSIHGASLYGRQLRRDREHDQQRHYTENLTPRVNETRNYLKESRGQQVQPNQVRFPRDLTPQFLSKNVADRNMYSETADTIVTWSESQNSPRATMALRRAREQYCHRQNSTTPDSVRGSMEKTGIFKDTGVESSSRRKSHMREAVSKRPYGTREKVSASTTDGPAVISRDLSSLSTDSTQKSHEISPPPNFQQQDCLSRPLSQMGKKTEDTSLERKTHDSAEIRVGLQRTVVEYYDPNRGWYRKEGSKPPSKSPERPSDLAVAPIPTPLTRQQMARNARIKRPSTTLPVIREASDESRENSSSSISGIPEKGIQRTESAPIRSSSVKGDMSGYISPISGRARQDNGIPEPQVPEPMSPQPCSQSHHGQHSWFDRLGETTNNISGNAIPQSEMTDDRGRQLPLTSTTHLNGRTHTPLGTIPYINSNSEHFQFSTEPPFERGFPSRHEWPTQHTTSTPRSPFIRLPSLYVQQLEIEQEKNQTSNDLPNERIERHGGHDVQGPNFNTEAHGENWDNTETEQEMSYGVKDVLENRRCIGDLGELGPQEANACEAPLSRHEVTGLWYENSNLDLQTHDYQPQHTRGQEYNQWDSDNFYLQEHLIETRQNLQQLYEMDFLSNQLVQRSLPAYREPDEGQDGNASESILMQRFWRPNPQY